MAAKRTSMMAAVTVLLWIQLCLCCAREITEGQLYQSEEWEDSSRPLIFTKPGSIPLGFLKHLLSAVERSDVVHFKVECSESQAGQVCESLAAHRITTRVGGAVKGLATPPQGYNTESAFIIAVLEQLLASSITQVTTYSELADYTSAHPQHLLLLAPDTASEEYAALLSALLIWPLPLAVTMTANALPLSRRPHYSSNPPSLQLWCVVQYEDRQSWHRFQESSSFVLGSDVDHGKSLAEHVTEFVERFQYPIIVRYEDDVTLTNQFSGSGLHLAVIFPGLSGASDIDIVSLATTVSQTTYMSYGFVLADRSLHSEYGKRLYVTDRKPLPHITMLPYGQETNYIGIELEGADASSETQRVVGIMDSFLNDHPKGSDGFEDYSELGPSMTVVPVLKAMAEERKYHILAYFCLRDSGDCMSKAFGIIREVLIAVRRTDLGRSLAAHVVHCKSVTEIQQFELSEFPGCALYNMTTSTWSPILADVSSKTDIVGYISHIAGVSELEGIVDTLSNGPRTMRFSPPPPPPLQEEDHLNLVARSLKHPTIPAELKLTSATFDLHITKFLKTAVVFCVKWSVRCKIFNHHVMAALDHLDKALNVSLATVGCDEFTDLCTRLHITTYPTILLFTPSTLHSPQLLTGTLDSTHLLAALGQLSTEHADASLSEFTPSSLPSLLSGGLERTLVLWCDKEATSAMAKAFTKAASTNDQSMFEFLWINSTKHSQLLSRILPSTATFPLVVAVNFKEHTVHHLPNGNAETFQEDLATFLTALSHGALEASFRLGEEAWLPLQPPVPFPSPDYDKEDVFDEDGSFHDEGYHGDHEPMMDDVTMPHPHAPPTTGHRHHHQHTEL